jgi:hypothetical protein
VWQFLLAAVMFGFEYVFKSLVYSIIDMGFEPIGVLMDGRGLIN